MKYIIVIVSNLPIFLFLLAYNLSYVQGKNTASVLAGIKAAVSLEILSAGPMFLRYDSLEQVSRVEIEEGWKGRGKGGRGRERGVIIERER